MKTDWKAVDFSRIAVVSYDLGFTILGFDAKQVAKIATKHFGINIHPAAILLAEENLRRDIHLHGDHEARSQSAHFSDVLCEIVNRIHPIFKEAVCEPHKLEAFKEECRVYHDEFNFFDQIYHDAFAALNLLRKNRIRIIAISNAQGTLDRDMRKYGLHDYFEYILDSGAEGVAKPDPEIFTRALDRCGVAAESVLHIGDNPTADVRGAMGVGMQSALYDPIGMFPSVPGAALHFQNHVELVEQLLISQH
jgi:HAD superfamily hydrolase (TIGR01549 family)